MSNKNLLEKYEEIYGDSKEDFFSRFVDGKDIIETDQVVWSSIDWSNKKVLDIGCGSGETAVGIANLGAKFVLGIDYSENAIKIANERYKENNLEFKKKSFKDFSLTNSNLFDVVISCGTLEHMDNPSDVLQKMLRMVNKDGKVILTSPYFVNLRGIIWMSLVLALDVPMSLTDKHFIFPFNIKDWLIGTDFELENTTYFDFDRANGKGMLTDMEKRLKNALNDANLPTNGVPKLMDWLKKVVKNESASLQRMNGSSALYFIGRKN